jgi:hypothetical protein
MSIPVDWTQILGFFRFPWREMGSQGFVSSAVHAGYNSSALVLQPLVDAIYARSRYARDIDYRRPLKPALTEAEQAWLDKRLKRTRSERVVLQHLSFGSAAAITQDATLFS